MMCVKLNALRSVVLGAAIIPMAGFANAQGSASTGRASRELEQKAARTDAYAPEQLIDDGFVFLDGEYLSPPYIVSHQGSNVFINGQPIETVRSDRKASRDPSDSEAAEKSLRRLRREIEDSLYADGIVVAFSGQTVSTLHGSGACDLLKALTDDGIRSDLLAGSLSWVDANIHYPAWRSWIIGFKCSSELAGRAEKVLNDHDRIYQKNLGEIAAKRTLEAVVYPFTVLGMVLCVFSTGHLLSSKPSGDPRASSPQIWSTVGRSLVLVIALSSLDVIWTILISRTGAMKELNPLGSALIEDPFLLVAFKAATTFGAVGILLSLRHHTVARAGSWWACLICTLLMMRWLTFNSMFVG